MKKNFLILSIITALVCSINMSSAQNDKKQKNLFDWNNNFDPEHRPINNPNAKKLPLIKVKGNKFVNSSGDNILFRGVAIADPDKIEQEARWSKNLFMILDKADSEVSGVKGNHERFYKLKTIKK